MILDIERAIVERLATALAPLPVQALPARGYRFDHAKGAAVVAAARVAGSAVRDTAVSIQEAEASFDVTLLSRSLRDGAGAWDLFEAVRIALLSWRPIPGATPLWLLDAQLDGVDADAWIVKSRWATRIPLIPDLQAGSAPLLTRVTLEEI